MKLRTLLRLLVSMTIAGSMALSAGPVVKASGAVGWTQFGFDATHRGFNPYETTLTAATVQDLKLAYARSLGTVSYRSYYQVVHQPVVADGLVYAAVNNGIYALDATTGEQIWHRSGCGHGPLNMPAIAGGHVWAGGSDGIITAFDARTGAVSCVQPVSHGRSPVNPPAVVGDRVFTTDRSGFLIAFSATTLSVLYTRYLNGQPLNAPAFDWLTGDLYISTHTGLLYRVSAAMGHVIWVNAVAWVVASGAADLYVATTAGKDIVLAIDGDVLFTVDAKTGAVGWAKFGGGPPNCETGSYMPAGVAYGLAYQANPDCGSDAFNVSTGKHVWHTSTGTPLDIPLTAANGLIYVPEGGLLFLLNAQTGAGATYLRLPCLGYAPTVVNGTLYMIAGCNGSLSLVAYRT